MLQSGQVLGVDIGFSKKKSTTGICMLSWDKTSVQMAVRNVPTDSGSQAAVLAELIGKEKQITCAALDAPIRGALDEIGEYRIAERILTRKIGQYIGKPGQASSGNGRKLNQSANRVARMLVDMQVLNHSAHAARIHDLCLVEAFPTAFLGVMLPESAIPKAGTRSDVYFEQLLGPETPRPAPLADNHITGLLARLLPQQNIDLDLRSVENHDQRAALICAITALCVAQNEYVAVGDRENGYIILPPLAANGMPGTQEWAMDLIRENASTEENGGIVSEHRKPIGLAHIM